MAIHNGTLADPIAGATEADVTSTLTLQSVQVDQIGSNFTEVPTVTVTDPTGSGSGAMVTASVEVGAIKSITVTNAGSGYLSVGMKKFQDELPLTCDPKADGTGCPAVDQTARARARARSPSSCRWACPR